MLSRFQSDKIRIYGTSADLAEKKLELLLAFGSVKMNKWDAEGCVFDSSIQTGCTKLLGSGFLSNQVVNTADGQTM